MSVVAPFFRASVILRAVDRALCQRGLAASAFEAGLREAPDVLRQNLRRLFGAALLAEALGAPLVSVEGWRSNAIHRSAAGRVRFVTGSWWFAIWHRVLARRGLLGRAAFIRRDVSRCTWEEAAGLVSFAGSLSGRHSVIGVSDSPCPSAARAARYLRAGDEVVTPSAAIARAAPLLAPSQLAFWSAIQSRRSEARLARLIEAPNWLVHGISQLGRLMTAGPPLEARLARALRADRPRGGSA